MYKLFMVTNVTTDSKVSNSAMLRFVARNEFIDKF